MPSTGTPESKISCGARGEPASCTDSGPPERITAFGSQVTQLIARRVREEGVYSEIVPFQKAEQAFKEMKPKAVILSGGPESVHEAGSPRAPQLIFDSGVPVLGICYGQMTMAEQLGGTVEGGHHREFGRADVEVKADSKLFEDVWSSGSKNQVWMSHGCLLYTSPSPRDRQKSRMPSSA